jgi:hypothetical protein
LLLNLSATKKSRPLKARIFIYQLRFARRLCRAALAILIHVVLFVFVLSALAGLVLTLAALLAGLTAVLTALPRLSALLVLSWLSRLAALLILLIHIVCHKEVILLRKRDRLRFRI